MNFYKEVYKIKNGFLLENAAGKYKIYLQIEYALNKLLRVEIVRNLNDQEAEKFIKKDREESNKRFEKRAAVDAIDPKDRPKKAVSWKLTISVSKTDELPDKDVYLFDFKVKDYPFYLFSYITKEEYNNILSEVEKVQKDNKEFSNTFKSRLATVDDLIDLFDKNYSSFYNRSVRYKPFSDLTKFIQDFKSANYIPRFGWDQKKKDAELKKQNTPVDIEKWADIKDEPTTKDISKELDTKVTKKEKPTIVKKEKQSKKVDPEEEGPKKIKYYIVSLNLDGEEKKEVAYLTDEEYLELAIDARKNKETYEKDKKSFEDWYFDKNVKGQGAPPQLKSPEEYGILGVYKNSSDIKEMSSTGGGAAGTNLSAFVTPGSGEGVAAKYAFAKPRKKKKTQISEEYNRLKNDAKMIFLETIRGYLKKK